jgi:hypothetical protein
MIQYLYAAYSLGGPQVPKVHQEVVIRWQKTVLGMAKEEMAHFVTVQNVLRLIGGSLNLERADFPWGAQFVPFDFTLGPLILETLARYVYVEGPKNWPQDAEPYKQEILRLAGVPPGSDGMGPIHRVGVLYDAMIALLKDPVLMPDHLFQAETLVFQASPDEWGRGYATNSALAGKNPNPETADLIIQPVYSRQTAVNALQVIADQGESDDIDETLNQHSHFRRFLNIYQEYPKAPADWSPFRPLAVNPTTVDPKQTPQPNTTWLGDPVSRAWGELLNLRYRMLLLYLTHSFRLSGGSSDNHAGMTRGMVLHNTVGEMYNLRTISRTMVRLPSGPGTPGVYAGPPFEMPYSLLLPLAERDVWLLHLDLLQAAQPMIHHLTGIADPDGKRYLLDLAVVDRSKAAAIETILGTGPSGSGNRS